MIATIETEIQQEINSDNELSNRFNLFIIFDPMPDKYLPSVSIIKWYITGI